MIYLDNAATTYPKPEEMYKANDYAQRNLAFNAGRGSYKESKEAHQVIEECREFLCLKANAKSLVFTPSATHALNMIINGLDIQEDDIVYCSPYDHNAIVRTLNELARKNKFIVKVMDLKEDLTIDIDKLRFNCIKDKPKAVFCTHVSNVTGYVLPIDEIGSITHDIDTQFIVDGAQAFGLVPVDIVKSNIDYYVFAGHKTLYGPFGIAGILSKEKELSLSTTFYGGTGTDSLNVYVPEEGTLRFEPASPNVVSMYSLLESAKWIFNQDALQHERSLTKQCICGLQEIDEVELYVTDEETTTGIVSFNIKGYKSGEVAKILAEDYGILTRSDYHCCPYIHEHLGTIEYLGTVRVSFSCFSTEEECNKLISAVEEIAYDI